MRANRLVLFLFMVMILAPVTPVRCEDESGGDWWSNLWGSVTNALSGAGQWINDNIVQPVSNAVSGAVETVKSWIGGAGEAVSNALSGAAETVNNAISSAGEAISSLPETVSTAVQGAGEWLQENVYKPAGEWWYWNVQKPIGDWWSGFYENWQQQMEQLAEETEETIEGGGEEEGGGGTTWIDQTVDNIDRYFEGSTYLGEEAHPTGETGMDLVDDIADLDFPTLWLGWDIPLPWGGSWKVGVDLMAPFESMFNKAAEYSFELFFKKPVGLMWRLWSGTYRVCRNTGLAAPFAVTAAAAVETGVGITLVMILQKLVDIIL